MNNRMLLYDHIPDDSPEYTYVYNRARRIVGAIYRISEQRKWYGCYVHHDGTVRMCAYDVAQSTARRKVQAHAISWGIHREER